MDCCHMISRRLYLLLITCVSLIGPLQSLAHDHLRVLVSTRTTGFRHGSIEAGLSMMRQLATNRGWDVLFTEDDRAFTEETLAHVDVIVFLNTTGFVVDRTQWKNVENFVRNGGGFVGIHAAADSEYQWPFYNEMIGSYFLSHPAIQTATIHVHDTLHPSTAHLGSTWVRRDEWYDFRTRPRDSAHVLMVLDEGSYSGGRMGLDHPIAWCKTIGNGRSWYTAGGHTDETYSEPDFVQHVVGGIEWAAGKKEGDASAFRWQSYSMMTVTSDIPYAVGIEPLPDGRVVVIGRSGTVWVVDPRTGTLHIAHSYKIALHGENGLLGVTRDSRRTDSTVLYLMIADRESSSIRIQREILDDTLFVPSASRTIISFPYDVGALYHIGGGMAFDGTKGQLYIGTGDNTDISGLQGFAPLDERPGQRLFDAQRTSANTNSHMGKILRIQPHIDGSGYSIPPDNLFAPGTPSTLPEIFAMGLRNPFRFSMDAATGEVLIGDVGPDASVDHAVFGTKGFDEINLIRKASNLGWPYFVADNRRYNLLSTTMPRTSRGSQDPTSVRNVSPNSTGRIELPPAVGSIFAYQYHDDDTAFVGYSKSGRSIACGQRITLPTQRFGFTLPPSLQRGWVYYDFARGWIRLLLTDPSAKPIGSIPIYLRSDSATILDVKVSALGEMFAVVWDSRYSRTGEARLVRVVWNPGSGLATNAVIRASTTSGPVPLAVEFDGTASQGNVNEWQWDVDGDGVVDARGPSVQYVYDSIGTYRPTLHVRSVAGATATSSVTIVAGHSPPVIRSITPTNGQVFDEGANILYQVDVTDDHTPTDSLAIDVEMQLGHDDHSHPVSNAQGAAGTLLAPTLRDHGDARDLYGVLYVRCTDSGYRGARALVRDTTITIQPRRKEAEHGTISSTSRVIRTEEASGNSAVQLSGKDSWVVVSPLVLTDVRGITIRIRTPATCRISFHANHPEGYQVARPVVVANGGMQFTPFHTIVTEPVDTMKQIVVVAKELSGASLDIDWIEFTAEVSLEAPALRATSAAVTLQRSVIDDDALVIDVHRDTSAVIRLFSLSGGEVSTMFVDRAGRVVLPVGRLTSGSYFVSYQGAESYVALPFIILR